LLKPLGRVVIVRYSEVAVKGPRSRPRMERILASNIREALARARLKGRIERSPGRILVWEPDDVEAAALAAARVFGVKSVSPAVAFRFETLDDIVGAGVDYFAPRLRGRSFRVTARRVGDHEFTSLDVERSLGAALLDAGAGPVNLTAPEAVAYVEVRGDTVFLYDRIIEGPGGLPLGSEEPSLVLYSGGFDSTAAWWLIWRRGSPADAAYFDLGVPEALENALETARVLAGAWGHGHRPTLHVADFTDAARTVAELVAPRYRVIVMRRLMVEEAAKLALERGYEALVTGESVGQVATQTIRNLRLIGSNLPLPVIRPVSGMDKDEVVALTRRIGVYGHVSRQIEACRAQVNPTPRANPERFREELARVRGAYKVRWHTMSLGGG